MGEATHQQRPEAFETLSFSLHDALRRVKELEDGSIAAADVKAEPAGASGPRDTSKVVQAYHDMEGPICAAVLMIGIAVEFANGTIDRGDQLAFAVNHSQQMLEYLKARFYKKLGGHPLDLQASARQRSPSASRRASCARRFTLAGHSAFVSDGGTVRI